MIYAMKFVRYFMVIGLCLSGSSATAMLKLKINSNPSSENSVPMNVLSLPRMNLIANILNVPSAMCAYVSTIDLLPYQKMVEGSIANNPKISAACLAACVLLVAVCVAKKSFSEERWKRIVDLLNRWADEFINKCYGVMPGWLRTTSTLTKTMCLQPLATFTQSYVKYNTIHAVFSIASLGAGIATGYSKTFVAIATMCALVGANQLGFNRLEAKMDANQAEINKNFETVRNDILQVRNDIINLGTNVTHQIASVNINVDTRAQEISGKINGLDDKVTLLGQQSQELAEETKKVINELKKSFTATLETKIELQSQQLTQTMKESDQNRNENEEIIKEDLKKLKVLVETFNSHSSEQDQKIAEIANIAEFLEKMTVAQNKKLEELGQKIDNVSEEVQKNIQNIKKDIKEFNEAAKKDAAQATEKIVQQISELGEKNEVLANKLNQELLEKIEEFINKTKAEGEALKKEIQNDIKSGQDDLQVKVDNIQKQQNVCAEILNTLQDSHKNQDSKVEELIILAKSNQEEIGALGITAGVQIETINERLDKIQGEVVANKQELLDKIDEVVQATSTIKKLLNVINEKDDAKYQQMSNVLEKTSALSGQVNDVNLLVASVKTGRDADSGFIKTLNQSMAEFKKEFSGLNISIDNVYHKIENFEKEQADQKKKMAEISSSQAVQGSQLEKLLEADNQKTKQMQDLVQKYEKLLVQNEEILRGQKNTDNKIDEFARQGDKRFDKLQEGQKAIVNALNKERQINPQRLRDARQEKKKQLEWTNSGGFDSENNF